MTDEEFIDKLNDITINYGYILIDMNNYKYYFNRYNLNKYYYKEYFEYSFLHKFILFKIKGMMFELGFHSIYLMLNGNDSIFKWIEKEMDCMNKRFPIDFVNFIMSIEGKTKEEILLKLQMMGY